MRKKILVIDDDHRNTFALAAILKTRGYEPIVASSMEQAFQIMDEGFLPVAILMDMMMPGMDGYEAIPKIKNDPKLNQIPLIAVTAQAMRGDREKCLAAGADGYISKPVDIDKLVELLKEQLHES